MANTFELIASSTLASSASSITFSSIPGTYTDLCLKLSMRGTTAATRLQTLLTFNSSTTGYSSKVLYAVNGNFVGSENGGSTEIGWIYITGSTATASTFSNSDIYIPNYAGATNKSVSIDASAEVNSSTDGAVGIAAGLLSNTAAITSLTITAASGSLVQYSTAYLYGVKNA
jgi:hypothetical protein